MDHCLFSFLLLFGEYLNPASQRSTVIVVQIDILNPLSTRLFGEVSKTLLFFKTVRKWEKLKRKKITKDIFEKQMCRITIL